MTLRFALLAALHEEPATGYDLNRRFRDRLGHVWNASHQQIYRELARMLDEALVAVQPVPQADRPDRKVYRVTQGGKRALQAWLTEGHPRPAIRDPFLVKLFAGELLNDADLERDLAELEAHYRERLRTYRSLERRWFPDERNLSRHYRLQYMALRRGILTAESWLQWAAEMRERMLLSARGASKGNG